MAAAHGKGTAWGEDYLRSVLALVVAHRGELEEFNYRTAHHIQDWLDDCHGVWVTRDVIEEACRRAGHALQPEYSKRRGNNDPGQEPQR